MFTGGGIIELTEENIFKKTSEYDVFSYYIPEFEALNKKFCSPLRNDSKPSCGIRDIEGKLFYKDFGTGEVFTVINFVKTKYNLNYFDALRVISNDFNLGLNKQSITPKSMGMAGKIGVPKKSVPKETIIKIKRREWNKGIDKSYWSEFGWTREMLNHFKICAISHLWINSTYLTMKPNNPSYAYIFPKNEFKILSPNSEHKWISNTSLDTLQGWEQLPPSGDLVVITSSLKDVGLLYKYGYPAVAPSAESAGISINKITELQERFKQIIILYDNDGEFDPEDLKNGKGKAAAKKLSIEYKLKMVFIPDGEPKDPSDFYKKHGDIPTKELLNRLL